MKKLLLLTVLLAGACWGDTTATGDILFTNNVITADIMRSGAIVSNQQECSSNIILAMAKSGKLWEILAEEYLPPGYKFSMNKEWVKVFYANETEPYRAWTIYYSQGLQFQSNGVWKSLYHEPKINHVDMRKWGYK